HAVHEAGSISGGRDNTFDFRHRASLCCASKVGSVGSGGLIERRTIKLFSAMAQSPFAFCIPHNTKGQAFTSQQSARKV
ncbi:MAG TPA: hypothetical protein VE170_11895, partial [Candidatus Limnocylindria bacterium]|nr:hypothetical protein [Candidatus Limnocylindria bacterium]